MLELSPVDLVAGVAASVSPASVFIITINGLTLLFEACIGKNHGNLGSRKNLSF